MSAEGVFKLQHPGTCTGMFWRGAPPGKVHRLEGNAPDWPRNGAILKGVIHELPEKHDGNALWLEVLEFQQAGEKEFVKSPQSWMIFEQNGQLLHKVE